MFYEFRKSYMFSSHQRSGLIYYCKMHAHNRIRCGAVNLLEFNFNEIVSALSYTLQDCHLMDLINNNSISNYKSNLPK